MVRSSKKFLSFISVAVCVAIFFCHYRAICHVRSFYEKQDLSQVLSFEGRMSGFMAANIDALYSVSLSQEVISFMKGREPSQDMASYAKNLYMDSAPSVFEGNDVPVFGIYLFDAGCKPLAGPSFGSGLDDSASDVCSAALSGDRFASGTYHDEIDSYILLSYPVHDGQTVIGAVVSVYDNKPLRNMLSVSALPGSDMALFDESGDAMCISRSGAGFGFCKEYFDKAVSDHRCQVWEDNGSSVLFSYIIEPVTGFAIVCRAPHDPSIWSLPSLLYNNCVTPELLY